MIPGRSPVSDPNDVTLASYEAGADKYVAATRSLGADQIAYLDRIAAAVPDGEVLELGSGAGRDALLLEQRGLRVIRSDAAQSFLDLMRSAGYEARRLDVRSDPLGGPYDAIIANAVLLHLDRDVLRDLLVRARDAIRPGGLLAFTLKEGDGEEWTERKGLHRHFYYWREPQLRAALEAAGWHSTDIEHLAGHEEPWLRVFATR